MPYATATPRIQLGWEVLPDQHGTAHAVDFDPDTRYDAYQVSLCGATLLTKGGHVTSVADFCEICQDVSHERQQAFDARQQSADVLA